MRVIAGTAGGLRLSVPKTDVRPTMDRVKAAIFSSLGDRVIEARVLDLFAGSGGLGIEALSRGASSAVFVENDRSAVSTIEQNLALTRMSGRVRRNDVFDFLRQSGREDFDLIFADPPYDREGESFTQLLLRNDSLFRRLTSAGVFVLEQRPGEDLPATELWEVIRQKRYGATETLFLRKKNAS